MDAQTFGPFGWEVGCGAVQIILAFSTYGVETTQARASELRLGDSAVPTSTNVAHTASGCFVTVCRNDLEAGVFATSDAPDTGQGSPVRNVVTFSPKRRSAQ